MAVYDNRQQSRHYSQGNHGDIPPDMNKNKSGATGIHELLNRLTNGKADSDSILIIMLIIILAGEGADMSIILALIYVLL
jgi:hypothetical protein